MDFIQRKTTHDCETTLHSLSTLNPHKDSSFSTVASNDPNKHGSERMRRVLEQCSAYYWWQWHQVDALHRAETIQTLLPPEGISFVRMVRQSDQRIYMSPPNQFIRSLHPGDYRVAVLEDESGREFKVDFFDKNWSLSSGWKEFCVINKLLKKDYLVFHWVQPSKFEVYVVNQTNEAVVVKTPLPSPCSCLKDKISDKETLCVNEEKRPRKENLPEFDSKKQADAMFGAPSEDLFYTQKTESLSPSENELTFEPSQSASESKNFRIIIDGIDITSEIPECTRISYLNLCGTHSSLLHSGLTVGINPKHAVFIISTTTDICNAMKNSTILTPPKEIVYWSKSLESFSTMGMDVGFMRERVERLLELAIKVTKAVDMEKYEEMEVEGEGLEENIKHLELEIEKMREKKRKIDDEREGIKKKVDDFEAMFKLEATSPW